MYLNMDCKICGRHRVEEDYICEKCGYDNKNLTFSSVKVRKTTQEVITVDKLSQPILECLEHGAGTCRNEYLIEILQKSCEGFRDKNKVLAEELCNLRIAKCDCVALTTRVAKLEGALRDIAEYSNKWTESEVIIQEMKDIAKEALK